MRRLLTFVNVHCSCLLCNRALILFEIYRRDGCSVLFEYREVYNRNDYSWNKNVLNRQSYGVYYFINELYIVYYGCCRCIVA